MKIGDLTFKVYQDDTGVYFIAEPAKKGLFRIRIDLVEECEYKKAQDIANVLTECIKEISLL